MFSSAVDFYLKSLDLNKQLQNENGVAMINSNLALLYADMKMYDKALENFISTYSIRKAKGEKVGTISALINMSVVLNNLKRYDESISHLKEALDISREMSDAEQMKSCYGMLSETYEKAGMADTAFYYFNLYKSFHEMIQAKKVKESNRLLENEKVKTQLAQAREQQKELELLKSQLAIQQRDSALTIAGEEHLQLRANLSKKELQVEVLRQTAEIKELKAFNEIERREKRYAIILSVAVVLIGIVLFQLFLYRHKKQSNHKLKHANKVIKYKNEQLQAQFDKVASQHVEITDQRDKIEDINRELTDSINYAKYIQHAILPTKEELDFFLKDYFIFFQPKDIVSGDFYWAGSAKGLTVFAVADCTGHGVPGAFMSVLGMTLLNEIVIEKEIVDSFLILEKLRSEIIHSLHQKGTVGEQRDGMDISVCVVDKQNQTVQFSGANNPLYVSRSIDENDIDNAVKVENCNSKIFELKGDRMPICIYDYMGDFNSHFFQFEKGDVLYLFSDGYADQFGGDKGKKLKYKAFKKLLLDNNDKSLEKQSEIIGATFDLWKNGYEQVDDVIVMGVRL